MITIGIELNHVVRNVNKQIVKYYDKAYQKDIDIDGIDYTDDPFKIAVFSSKHEKNNFIFIDYPYEIFGCADTMETRLAVKITNWLTDASDIEDEDIRIVFYSLGEEALSIQSTYFFLSKIGARVREVFFPKKDEEVWDKCDVVITANKDILSSVPQGKKAVMISRKFNEDFQGDVYKKYGNLSEVIEDNNFFKELLNKDAKKQDNC